MAYVNKSYLSTQFSNFASKILDVFAKKSDLPTNVSTTKNGLAPKVTNTNGFLKGDGTWAVPQATLTWNE